MIFLRHRSAIKNSQGMGDENLGVALQWPSDNNKLPTSYLELEYILRIIR
jgi:hypothetical protein